MDVTCERCGTEYEFDETLVSDRGTTVKCTNCGHLFKVFRPGAGPGGQDRSWSIRTQDGTTMNLGSLRELQRLITQGELSENDQISRSGEGWKPLGSIAELQTFFAAARAVKESNAGAQRRDGTLPFETGPAATPFKKTPSASPPQPPRAFANTEMAPHVPPAPSRGSQSGPLPQPPSAGPPRSAKGTIMGVGGSSQQPARTAKSTLMSSAPPPPGAPAPPVAVPPPARVPGVAGPGTRRGYGDIASEATMEDRPRRIAPTREASGAPQPPRPPPPGPAAPSPSPPRGPSARPGPQPSAPAAARPASGRPARGSDRPARALHFDDADEDLRPPKRGRAALWVVLVLLLGAGIGAGLAWDRIAPALGLGAAEDPIAPFLARGDEALALDHIQAYERAKQEYTRGTAIAERDPRILGGLSRAHALHAQTLDFHADDLEARAAADPALAGEAAALRREQARNAEEARRLAEDAVRQNPNDLGAVLALADALRMTGDPRGASSHLERAARLEPEPGAEHLRVAALMEIDRAGGDASAAREKAAQSVERDPAMIRSRLLYARALLAEGNVAQARGQIDAVLQNHPEHPEAQRLRLAIEQGLPPAAPVVVALDAGVADAGPAAEETPVEVAEAAGGGAAGGGGGGGGGAVPRGRDYSWYIHQGDRALESGDVARARQLFEAALQNRAGGPEALTGLGYVLLGQGNFAAAAARFQQASSAGYAPAFIGLGSASQELGRSEQAASAYEAYLARMPSGPEASIARRQLDALRRAGAGAGGGGGGTGGAGGGETGTGETGTGGAGGETGGGTEPSGGEAPPTPPGTLPAPRGTDPDNPPPSSDPPAIGSEKP